MPSISDTDPNEGDMHRSNSRAFSEEHTDNHKEHQSNNPDLPLEIPDSQPDDFDYELDEAEDLDDSASFKTVVTEIIPGGTQLTPNCEARWPLHLQGVNCNGRLPCEAPQYYDDMEEEPTQPSTQPFLDPRRRGITSSLNDQDESDIICVLYPTSLPAHEAVKLTAEAAPQHIYQNHGMSHIVEEENNVNYEEMATRSDQSADSDVENSQLPYPAKGKDDSGGLDAARDIALRFSSKVHNMCLGFVFGRNPKVCDLLLCGVDNKQVSNKHFRIFVNSNGVLMLEDTSTNGTIVDGILLQGSKSKTAHSDAQPRRTLTDGEIIELPTITRTNGKSVRFHVRMFSRNTYQAKYNQNLATYLACVEQAERQAVANADLANTGLQISLPPMSINLLQRGTEQDTTPGGSILAAATGQHHHGLHWNGGDKYNVIGYIGKGAFAMVYKLSSKRDGEVYAVKEIDKAQFAKNGASAQKARKELDVIKNLRHPNIVKYIDHLDTPTHLFIVMEFVPFGDLCAWTGAGKVMPEYICVHLARQIMQALGYLHQRQIVHRDIKPDNILMACDFPYVFKLSDFGLSKMITNKADYLKTFCGTLLYCAPEIYPGYERVKMGLPPSTKRTRANAGPQPKTQRYENSVDTWSFAAVLYHLLCGRAPFDGAHEQMMLTNVMNTPIEWDRLRQAGISAGGIDFVQNMLVLEPSQRSSDDEVLDHPWLLSANDKLGLGKEQPTELDASQLSLADDDQDEGDGLEYYDDMEEPRESKRIRVWPQEDDVRDVWGQVIGQPQVDTAGPAPSMSHPPQPQRLFGEIGTSALRSSGVLGQTAHAALDVHSGGSYDPAAFGVPSGVYEPATLKMPGGGSYDPATMQIPRGGSDNPSSASASYMYPGIGRVTSAEDVSYIDPNYVSNHPTNEGVTQQNVQYPQLLSGAGFSNGAPSLLGAEALVDQLNMTSPDSGVSDTSGNSQAASPKTPHSRGLSPTLPGSKRSSQDPRSAEDEAISKRSKIGHTSSSLSTRRQSGEASTQLPPHVSQASAGKHGRAASARKDATQHSKAKDTSQSSDSDDHQDGQQPRESTKSNVAMPPTAFNSQGSAHDSNGGDKTSSRPASRGQPTSSNAAGKAPANKPAPPSITYTRPSSSGNGPTITIANAADFIKPSMVFGNLVIIKGSVPSVHKIKITSRSTTFGRDLSSTFVHQNSMDTRVPKNAIDIQMWHPNIDHDIKAGRDWSTNKELRAIISTRTNLYIKINGIRLMKGKDCWLYGELRSGDVVSIFELAEGAKAVEPRDKEFLRFKCEFYVGASRENRKEGDQFTVHKEAEKFKMHEARKSRESTEAVDLIPDNYNSKGNEGGSRTAAKTNA